MSNNPQFSIFKCDLCEQVIEVLFAGSPSLVCCGQPMKEMKAGTSDGAAEKHVPVLEKKGDGCTVKVGSVPHPMVAEHYIEWIEVATKNGYRCKKYLNPGDAPEADFPIKVEDVAEVREYCNLHGLWKA